MTPVMRKSAFCICKNKGADQLHGNRKADQCHCFLYIDNTIPLPKFQASVAVQPQFPPDLVRNPEDRFSHDASQMM